MQHFGWKVFSTCHCKLSVSSCKRAFDEQFVFLYSAFRCAASRFSFSALSSLISWGLVRQYRLRIAIFEQAKYTRAEEGEKMLSSLRVSPSSRVAIFTRALVLRSHFYSWGKWRDHLWSTYGWRRIVWRHKRASAQVGKQAFMIFKVIGRSCLSLHAPLALAFALPKIANK